MPKKEMDYSKTVIYKIICIDPKITDVYVGHTTNFTKRKYTHKDSCTNENSNRHNLNVYRFIRENGNWNNWNMVPVEEYPCESFIQASMREQYWMDMLKPKLNTIIAATGLVRNEYKKQYQQKNKGQIQEKAKAYYELNKEKLKERRRMYYRLNKK